MTTISSITTDCTYMEHEGGTKFYEVVVLHAADFGKHLVIKRWGKIDTKTGGGEILITPATSARTAMQAASKIINGKKARGYSPAITMHGLHSLGTAIDGTEAIKDAIKAHYANGWQQILRNMDFPEYAQDVAAVKASPPAKPEPEIDRGDNWGSW